MSRRRISAVVTALALAGSVPLFMPANEASAASCSSYPAWSADANYNTGDIVRYTDGKAYIAEHANPGYDLLISTWYWEPYACDGGSQTPVGNFVVSEAQFNQMFPGRNSFYTYSGLTAALSAYPGFANTGSDTTKKQEAAAFLANVSHETGGLVHIVEQNTANYPHYCDWSQPYGCPAGQAAYYGRGPIQLSWNFNYKAAGDALGIDLLGNPWLVQNDAAVASEDRPVVLEHPVRARHHDPAQRDGQRCRVRPDHPLHQRLAGVRRQEPRPGPEPRHQVPAVQPDPRGLPGGNLYCWTLPVCETPPMTSETITAESAGTWAPRRPARPSRRLRRDAADGQRRLPPRHPERPRALLAVLRRAVELGVNHIDTAAFYFFPALGQRTDQQRAGLYADDLVVATKVGPYRDWSGRGAPPPRPEDLRGHVEENLRQLGRDHLDVVYLRRMRKDSIAEHFGALAELRGAG